MRLHLTGSATIILLLASAAIAADEHAKNGGETAHPEGDAIIETAPRAAQIEPVIVAPVKREVPKTPNIDMDDSDGKAREANAKSDAAGTGESTQTGGTNPATKSKPKVIGDRPNCDAGFKVDDSGKSCVKIAKSEAQAKKRRR